MDLQEVEEREARGYRKDLWLLNRRGNTLSRNAESILETRTRNEKCLQTVDRHQEQVNRNRIRLVSKSTERTA